MSFSNARPRDAVIVPTYGYIYDDHALPGARGSIVRLQRVCELIRKGVIDERAIIPFPQGAPNKGAALLGANVAQYAETLHELQSARIRTFPNVRDCTWGTWADTIASYGLINEDLPPGRARHVHFVSDWSQLGRLWLIWQVTKPKGWTASFHLAPNFRSWKDILSHEPLSYLKLIGWKIPKYLVTSH